MSPALLHRSTAPIAIYLDRGISPSASTGEPKDDHGCSLVRETLDEDKHIHIHPSFNIPDGDVTLIAYNTAFRVHRSQLRRSSTMFQGLFRYDDPMYCKYSSPSLRLVGCSPEHIKLVLSFIYPRRPGFQPTLSQSDWKLVYEFSYAYEFDTLWIRSAEELALDVSPLDKILIGRRRGEPALVQLGLREFAFSDALLPPDGSKQAMIIEYGGLMTIMSLRSAEACSISRAVEIGDVSPHRSSDETDDDTSHEDIATSPVETFTYRNRSLAISESRTRVPDSPLITPATHSDIPLPDNFPIRLTHPTFKSELDVSEVPVSQIAVKTILDAPREEELGTGLVTAEEIVRTETILLVPSASTVPDASGAPVSQRTTEIIPESLREEELIAGFVPSSSVVAAFCETPGIADQIQPTELADPTVRFNITFPSVPTVRQQYEDPSEIRTLLDMQDNSSTTGAVKAHTLIEGKEISEKYAIEEDASSELPSTGGSEHPPVQILPSSFNSVTNARLSVAPGSSGVPTSLDITDNSHTTDSVAASATIEDQIISKNYASAGGASSGMTYTGPTTRSPVRNMAHSSQSAVPDLLKNALPSTAAESSESRTLLDTQSNPQLSSFGSIQRVSAFSPSTAPGFAWGVTASKVKSRIGTLHKEVDKGPLCAALEIRSSEASSVIEGFLVDTSIPTASTPTPAAFSPELLELAYHNSSSSPLFLEATPGPEEDTIPVVDHTEHRSAFQPAPLSATIPPAANLLVASDTLLDTANLNEKAEDELCEDIDDNSGLNKSDDDQAKVQDEDEEQRDLKNREGAGIISRKDSRKGKKPRSKLAVDEQVEDNDEGSEEDDVDGDDDVDSDDDEEKDEPGSKPAAELTLKQTKKQEKKKRNKQNKKDKQGGKGGEDDEGSKPATEPTAKQIKRQEKKKRQQNDKNKK